MATATAVQSAPIVQGIEAPNLVVNPAAFYAATRRNRFTQRSATSWSGVGTTENVTLRQAGVITQLIVRVKGTLAVGTADVTSMSREWPHNLVKKFQVSANGQSNLISADGLSMKVHEFTSNPKINDRGISHYTGATAYTQGNLCLASENWGTGSSYVLGPGHTPGGTDTYTIDVSYIIPIAFNQITLAGAIFAQTSATNLNLEIQWNTQAALLTIGSAALTWTMTYAVDAITYSIPEIGGQRVIPDLSLFHQLSQFRQGGLTSGSNEIDLPGVGVGRQLMRVWGNCYSSSAPLAVNDTNYSSFRWMYGGNATPEVWSTGGDMRQANERLTGCDIGGTPWGIYLFDFCSDFALRDSVDEGMTANLRIVPELASSPTTGYAMTTQETLFSAPAGA